MKKPKPKVIRLKAGDCLTDEEADALAGTKLGDDSYDVLVGDEDVDVFKPDGTPLLLFRKAVLPAEVCRAAYPALRLAATASVNRGLASGLIPAEEGGRIKGAYGVGKKQGRGVRYLAAKKDGTLSNTNYAVAAPSGIIGYFDRHVRFPYCRQTAFNMNQPEKFAAALPFIRAVDAVFKKEVPERYAAQMAKVRETSKDFVIHGTAFTTVTVNRNFQTAVHKDSGDLKAGFGVMCPLRAGKYSGCYLVFPKFRVAVDASTRDVMLADVHEWHGNTPLRGIKGAFERIMCVLYFRSHMVHCGTAEEELERAKRRRRGEPLNS